MNTINKSIFATLVVMLCVFNLQAQRALPQPYPNNMKVNFIRVWDPVKPVTDSSLLTVTVPVAISKMNTQYFDGLGRPIQAVSKQGSLVTDVGAPASAANAVDVVSTMVYDEFGREQFKYMGTPASAADGQFKLNPFQQQATFYNNQFSGQGETYFYGQTQFENSPLNRVQKSLAPGNSWMGSNRGVENKYLVNTVTDSVRIWTVTDATLGSLGSYQTSSRYASGDLYKNIIVDEHGRQVIEFKDKTDQVILKKVQLGSVTDAGTGSGHANWICTYYIYDNLSNLRCVIQPEGVKAAMGASWVLSTTVLSEQCFRYEYDYRNRMIIKKVPGAGEVYLVYDARDRLVMTQDANLRLQGLWTYTEYDVLNRPVHNGFYNGGGTFLYHLEQAKTSNAWPNLSLGYGLLAQTFYDSYNWLQDFTTPLSATRITTYDSYFLTPGTSYPYAEALTQSTKLKGLATGQRDLALPTHQTIFSVSIYDDKGRVIQTQSTNIKGGLDVFTTQYNFSGQPLVTVLKQEVNGQAYLTVTKLNYDELGRLISVQKKVGHPLINGGVPPNEWTTILTNEYDALGQLKKKTLGGGLETLTNDYNIRGWLLGTNRGYLKDNNAAGYAQNYFGFELGYDKCTTTPGTCNGGFAQYNGNINAQVWKSASNEVRRRYNYWYDGVNRFKRADFSQNVSPAGGSWATDVNYGVWGFDQDSDGFRMGYDDNGNITSMIQAHPKPGNTGAIMDALRYQYESGSNRLQRVIDEANDNNSTLGDFKYDPATKSSTADYAYDANGNLTADGNKKISSITYNHHNQPQLITTNKGTIRYTYSEAGIKLQKLVTENNAVVNYNGTNYTTDIVTNTIYLGSSVFESKTYSNSALSALNVTDQLQFIAHEEGRVRYLSTANRFEYDYFIKDHLGNVRMVLTTQTDTANYFASMETEARATENQLFSGIDSTAIPISRVPGYAKDKASGAYVSRLNGNGKKMGPALVLKVTAGEVIRFGVNSFYRSNTTPGRNRDIANDIVSSFLSGVGGVSGAGKQAVGAAGSGGPITGALSLFRKDNNNTPVGKPKAFLNWMLLDDQFKYVSERAQSGAVPVDKPDELKSLAGPEIKISKSGFLYIYVSNETENWDVFFDNLAVSVVSSAILEETHYYPFGLTMAGISSSGVGKKENKYKFNKGSELQNKEFSDGSGLEVYDTQYRELDPQLGRWWQIDPEPKDAESPYAAMGNNPIYYNDPLGNDTLPSGKYIWEEGAVEELEEMVLENPNATWEPSFAERLYMLGQWLGFASPTGKLATVGKVEQTTQTATQAEKVIHPAATTVRTTNAVKKEADATKAAEQVAAKKGTQNPKVKKSTEVGRRAHKDIQGKATAKGWKSEQTMIDPVTGKEVRADLVTPGGHPVEIKPNSPSGKSKGAKQIKKYERATGNNGRVIYYNPRDYHP